MTYRFEYQYPPSGGQHNINKHQHSITISLLPAALLLVLISRIERARSLESLPRYLFISGSQALWLDYTSVYPSTIDVELTTCS